MTYRLAEELSGIHTLLVALLFLVGLGWPFMILFWELAFTVSIYIGFHIQ